MDLVTFKKVEKPIGTKEISDEQVIKLVSNGNCAAFEIIMRRYNQRLYRIARSILEDNDAAEDAVQQAYISAYYKLDNYTHTGRFGAWLTRITINEALMIKRKPENINSKNSATIDNDKVSGLITDPSTVYENKELAKLIESAIEHLPEEFRHVFVLRSIQQLSTKETADSLDINETTVKTRLHRARNIMQATLNKHIEKTGLYVYEFAGQRCDNIVNTVLKKLVELNRLS